MNPVLPVQAQAENIVTVSSNARTLQSYEASIAEYIHGTPLAVSGSVKVWIDAILATLPPQAEILEVGSAFGRDANYIEAQGFKVQRTDATAAFVSYLQTQGYAASLFNILTDPLPSQYDLIFANAVFLHFTPHELEMVLQKILPALTANGVLAFSVKKGAAEEWSTEKLGEPRYFCYWDEASLVSLLQKNGFKIVDVAEDSRFLQIRAVSGPRR